MIRYVCLALILFVVNACSSLSKNNNHEIELTEQAFIANKLIEHKIVDANRFVSHLSHVCTLSIEDKDFPVIDLRELVKGASSARGINQILILDSKLELVNSIEYFNHRPLFCQGNKLYIYGTISIDDIPGEGNIVVFDASGNIVDLQSVDTNEWF